MCPSSKKRRAYGPTTYRAAALNIPVNQIGSALRLLVGGAAIAQFDRDSKSYDIVILAIVLAIVLIYLVLAAQIESLRDPPIVLMLVALSIFGVIVPLNRGLGTLNIYTQVGLIALVVLITKHGILPVQFANQLRRDKGLARCSRYLLFLPSV